MADRQPLAGNLPRLACGSGKWGGWCASDENGLVVHQNPPAGTVVPTGATVNIANGRSPPSESRRELRKLSPDLLLL
jgi:hypothetical protein